MNVLLVWAAAGEGRSTPVLDWMIRVSERIHDPVEFYEGYIPVGNAVVLGWSSLREVLRSWELKTESIRQSGCTGKDSRPWEPELKNIYSVKLTACVRLAIHMGKEAIGDVAPPDA